MFECPTLETERLILRPMTEDDLHDYHRIHATPEVRAALHLPDDFSVDDAWRHLAVWRGQWALRNSGNWAIELKSTGEFVGRAGPHRPGRHDWPGLEIGWTLDPAHWGQGYATEAGRTSIEWAFANHDDDRLVSCISPDNTASQRVATRLGFAYGDTRRLSFLPDADIDIWVLPRPA